MLTVEFDLPVCSLLMLWDMVEVKTKEFWILLTTISPANFPINLLFVKRKVTSPLQDYFVMNVLTIIASISRMYHKSLPPSFCLLFLRHSKLLPVTEVKGLRCSWNGSQRTPVNWKGIFEFPKDSNEFLSLL